jgi:hypothetical protein
MKKEKLTDQEVGELYQRIKRYPSQVLQLAVCVAGSEMRSTDADQLTITTEMSFDDKKFKVQGEFIMTPIQPQPIT